MPTGSLAWADAEHLERLAAWGCPAERRTARRAADLEPALRVPAGTDVAYFPVEGSVHGDRAVEALLTRAPPTAAPGC